MEPLTPWTFLLNVAVTLLATAAPAALADGLLPVTTGAVRIPADGFAYSRRFGVPALDAVTAPEVDAETSFDATAAGVSSGELDSTAAAAPATCGDAMDVPLIEAVAVVEPEPADVMPTPGA